MGWVGDYIGDAAYLGDNILEQLCRCGPFGCGGVSAGSIYAYIHVHSYSDV